MTSDYDFDVAEVGDEVEYVMADGDVVRGKLTDIERDVYWEAGEEWYDYRYRITVETTFLENYLNIYLNEEDIGKEGGELRLLDW